MQETVLNVVVGVFVPLLTYVISDTKWQAKYKAGLSLLLSIVLSSLATISSVPLKDITLELLLTNATTVVASAQTIYALFLKGLNLEKFISPQEAVVAQAKEKLTAQLSLTRDEAVKLLDPVHPSHLIVNTTVTGLHFNRNTTKP